MLDIAMTALLLLGSCNHGTHDGAVDASTTDLAPLPAPGCGNTSGLQPGAAWPMRGYCPTHQGRSPFVGAQTPAIKWTFHTPGIVNCEPAVAADGTIYFGSIGNVFYAVHPDGTKKWESIVGSPMHSSPAIAADGTVYVGAANGNLYALNPDGTQKWAFDTTAPVNASPTIAGDGTIYVGSILHGFRAVNPDGTLKWAALPGEAVFGSAAVGTDDAIYVGTWDTGFYSFGAGGTSAWTFETAEEVQVNDTSPAIGGDGTIYTWSTTLDVHANDVQSLYGIRPDGAGSWRALLATGVTGSGVGAIALDGTIYVGSHEALYAVNDDGTQKWSFTTSSYVESAAAVGADGTIYVGNDDGHFYAVNPDGTQKWMLSIGSFAFHDPAIGADGTIYIAASDSNLYAIGP